LTLDDVLKDATPRTPSKPGMGSDQKDKTGGFDQANKDFDGMTKGLPVTDQGGGKRSAELPNGARLGVRPGSSSGDPTLQWDPPPRMPVNPVKIRYQ
jgi:hypothetical protein